VTICRYCGEIIRRVPWKDYRGQKAGERGSVVEVWESVIESSWDGRGWLVCVDPHTGRRGPWLWHQPFPASLDEMIELLQAIEEDLR
jgi:hypothetical protein